MVTWVTNILLVYFCLCLKFPSKKWDKELNSYLLLNVN